MQPAFGPPVLVDAWVQHVPPRRIHRPDGVLVYSNTLAIVRADSGVTDFSRITYDGVQYQVQLILTEEGIIETEALDLWLKEIDA